MENALRSWTRILVLMLFTAMLSPSTLFGSFQEGFHLPGPSSGFGAEPVVFDDGSGPRLFTASEGAIDGHLGNVFAWDGSAWSPVAGPAGGISGAVHALAVFDDGGGPALWALGLLNGAGGQPAALAAKWDGTDWTVPADLATMPTSGTVSCATVFNDGTGAALYVGGRFIFAGNLIVGVLRWTGTEWLQVGGTFDSPSARFQSLKTFDSGDGENLYALGVFPGVAGVPTNGIARWDGTAWSGLAGPAGTGLIGGTGAQLAIFDAGDGPKLYAAGSFDHAGGLEAAGLAAWDGTSWSVPELGIQTISATVHDFGTGDVLVVGAFLTGQGFQVHTWDGQVVTPLPDSLFNEWMWLDSVDLSGQLELIARGFFEQVSESAVNRAARWTGAGWETLSDGSGQGIDRQANGLTIFDDGNGPALYVGGIFKAAGSAPAEGLARWTAGGWAIVEDGTGQQLKGSVTALKAFDDGDGPVLMIAGFFTIGEAQELLRLVAWDGVDWIAIADQPNGTVHTMEVFDSGTGPELYLGGVFEQIGPLVASRIARFDGTDFFTLRGPQDPQQGVSDDVNALKIHGDHLYVGGLFKRAGNLSSVGGLARWDGTWSALPARLVGPGGDRAQVFSLESHDAGDGDGERLYVGGRFANSEPNSGALFNIAVWDEDSANFSGLGAGVRDPGTTQGLAQAMLSFDPGDGPSLFVTGDFSHAGPVESPHIARWDGADWRAVGSPTANGLDTWSLRPAMTAFDDGVRGLGLFLSGNFKYAGGVPSDSIAFFKLEAQIFTDNFENGDLIAWSEVEGE